MDNRKDAGDILKPSWLKNSGSSKEKKIDGLGNRIVPAVVQMLAQPKVLSNEEQIKELKAQIKALKKEKGISVKRAVGIQMMTPGKRAEKVEAEKAKIQAQLRKLANSGPLGVDQLTPSQVVDLNLGGLADLA